ncbi:MAG TPA: HEAT repeat domain-containing protein [Chthoniobacteraceae bacterium]|jgi:HEAT repeat protein/predicted negative regulator of RcsB-dependent stress response|nr:HEAT repeat domain-containing protein [Chthoniobacteraceae bacterium]
MNRWLPSLFVLAAWSLPVLAQQPEVIFQKAQTLEREGKVDEALRNYLAVPGGEYAAAALARQHREGSLALLREAAGAPPRWRLVEGDVLLALGRKAEALQSYRAVAAKIGATAEQGWSAGFLPPDYYPVEPPAQSEDDEPARRWTQLALPFELGPGSHRDNWLIRRFIALEAWPEAGAEFSRIWQLHRQETWPHRRAVEQWNKDEKPRWVRPAGFTGKGLQFALDYAFFLKTRGQADAAFGILLEPLLLLDLDRNPNFDHPGEPIAGGEAARLPQRLGIRHSIFLENAGISRSEFIRLAYGGFKEAGREDHLVAALENQIKRGENRARRVLARVRIQQGKLDEALQLELACIEEGKFNALSAEYRRGVVYEAGQKIPEAVAAFEKALALPGDAFDLADAEEESVERAVMSARLMPTPGPSPITARGGFEVDVLGRLLRLYPGLGETEKTLELTLRQFAMQPASLEDFNALEETARRFRAAGQEPQLTAWMTETAAAAASPAVRANLRWRLGDFGTAADEVARTPGFNEYTLDAWWERFAAAGVDKLRLLLKSVVAAHPEQALARLHLLDLDGQLGSKEAIPAFEALLASGVEPTFTHGRGPRNRTQFKGYFDVAYRLMRLYETHGEPAKLAALGLRIARGDKPFGALDGERFRYRNEADAPEFADAALAVAIEHAVDEPAQTALAAALKASPWTGARAQIERRIAGAWKPFPGAQKQSWANSPAGAELLASDENVLCLARDDRFFYSGHPWGVAVWDFAGAAVTRLALGEAVGALAVVHGHVWAGTPKGLFRIAPPAGGAVGKWSILHQPLDGDVPLEQRQGRSSPDLYNYGYDNGVYTLAVDGDLLWIGSHRNIQSLNVRTLELRPFSLEELKLDNRADFERIVPTARHVWADSSQAGLRRYDRATGEWAAIMKEGRREGVRFIGVVDDQVFGDVYIDDNLRHRPCRIDPETLEISPLALDGADVGKLINTTVRLLGKYGGQPAFATDTWPYVLDATGGKLRSLQAVMEKMNEERRATRTANDGPLGRALAVVESLAWSAKLFATPAADGWLVLDLPGGARVLGSRTNRTRYEYPHEDRTDEDIEVHANDGGLFFIAAGGKPERISAPARSGGLPADRVFRALPDGGQTWLCTTGGLAVRDAGGRIVQHFNRMEGLCADRIVGGAALAGRLYFGTGWGDSGGGLARWNPRTATFTTYFPSDGLATGKVEAVAVDDGRLRLQYGVEYLRYNAGSGPMYRRFPPSFFDPAKGAFSPPGKPDLLTQNDAQSSTKSGGDPLPYLGGYLLLREERDGKTWLCGTRGMLVIAGRASPKLTIASLGAKLVDDPRRVQLAEAKARPVPAAGAKEFIAALRDRNPFFRAKVLATLPAVTAELLPSVAALLDDPEIRVRGTALHQLTRSTLPDETLVPLFEARLRDADPYMRAVAALALARRGHLPPIAVLREIFQRRDSHGNFPYGADSSVGVLADATRLAEAVAPHATPEVFALLLEYPPEPRNFDRGKKVFPELGASLLRHPEVGALLLRAHDAVRRDPFQRDFAQYVFGAAGRAMLPVLHEALGSDDRVVRSNAARGCGAIGDPASIPLLLKALDLESGLSRASIVWALGELKAKEALPALAGLYADARHDEQRRRGSGFRGGQALVVMQAQYESLRSFESIAGDWDELKAVLKPRAIDPRRDEELLEPRHILEAVAKIGAGAAQDFYRRLAAEKEVDARHEASIHLAEGTELENLPVLRNLSADPEFTVRIGAAVSLCILNDASGPPAILELLQSPHEWIRRQTVEQLVRVKTPERLAFAAGPLRAIAADPTLDASARAAARRILDGIPKGR